MISIWERETFFRDADVLIAGGGLLGLWTAYELLKRKPGIRVTICEALPLAALASTRNAGFACFGSPGELWADKEAMGEDAMWQVVEMRFKGIQKIRNVLGDNRIDFEPLGGYELYKQDSDWNGIALKDKLDFLNEGFRQITGISNMYADKSNLLSFFQLNGFEAMAGNEVEGGLHSGKLFQFLMQLVTQAGAVYLQGYTVVEGRSGADSNREILEGTSGRKIEINAPYLIWATNAGLSKFNNLPEVVRPARGQVMLSPPVAGLSLRGTYHFDEGYYYFRNLGNRLLIGGARNLCFSSEETLDDKPTPEFKVFLETFIRDHFPQVSPYLDKNGWQHWAGIMGMGSGKLPFIHQISGGEWAALACNGMGVALTPVFAEEVAKQVLEA